ncbi:MAG TPA: DUF4118 domain-containing protein [Burkholderiales bacterium]|nr:DUF4118 domain-containing protein [Burkholderiales bacterium]
MSEPAPSPADPHPAWSGTTTAIPAHAHPLDTDHARRSRYPHRSWQVRYGITLALIATAFCLRYVVYADLNTRIPFAFFTPAALIAAWYGGIGPGFLVVVSGLLLGDVFFLPPHEALDPLGPLEQLIIGLYAASSAIGIGLIEHLHITIRRTERRLAEARAALAARAEPAAAAVDNRTGAESRGA